MNHQCSAEDLALQAQFEAGTLSPSDFSHCRHIQLAYSYLCHYEPQQALVHMRRALQNYLKTQGIDAGKYHETLTRAWLLAVHHFMQNAKSGNSADQFIEAYPILLDKEIMLTHYAKDVLFSEEARVSFLEPDIQQIPCHV